MPQKIATIDLSAKTAGATGSVSWSAQYIAPTLAQQQAGLSHHVTFYNESGCGLFVSFPVAGTTEFLAAGAWHTFSLAPSETSLNYSVDYVLPNAPVKRLCGIYYSAAEPVPPIPTLGNSPVGLGAAVASTQRVVTLPVGPAPQRIFNVAVSANPVVTSLAVPFITGATFSGTQPVTCYLYRASLQQFGYASGNLQLMVAEYDNTPTLLAAHFLDYLAFQATAPFGLDGEIVPYAQFTPGATCTSLYLAAYYTGTCYPGLGLTAGTPNVSGVVAVDIDLAGNPPIPTIGNGASQSAAIIY